MFYGRSSINRIRLQVFGIVQGVGYRAWVFAQANQRTLTGWVKNCEDGSVLLEAVGPVEALEELAEACTLGPRHARVERCERLDPSDESFDVFEIRR